MYSNKDALPQMEFQYPLRGNPRRYQEAPDATVGGLRNTNRSMRRVPGHMVLGPTIAKCLQEGIDSMPDLSTELLKALKQDKFDEELVNERVETLRGLLAVVLGIKNPHQHTGPAHSTHCSSAIRADLLEAWALRAGDPAAPIVQWLRQGTPSGAHVDMPDLGRLWVRKQDDGSFADPDDLDYDTLMYEPKSRENANDIHDMMKGLEVKGFVESFTDINALKKDLWQRRGGERSDLD